MMYGRIRLWLTPGCGVCPLVAYRLWKAGDWIIHKRHRLGLGLEETGWGVAQEVPSIALDGTIVQ